MLATTPEANGAAAIGFLKRGMDAPGRVVASWTCGGAIFFGGFLAAGVGLIQQSSMMMSYSGDLMLGGIGALAGLVHGSALAVLGRPRDTRALAVVADILRGAIWAVPLLAFGLVLAPVIALGAAAVVMSQPLLIGAAVVAALFGALICVWAAAEGWQALRRACQRWPEHRWGIPLVSTTALVLLVAFVTRRPAIWWTDVHVTQLGAVLLALGATLWLAVPVEYVGLHLLHRWRIPR
jgi:hypothetical protein